MSDIQGWFWIATSIAFEVLGDFFVKRLSISGSVRDWIYTLLSYNVMLISWMLAIRLFKNITAPGIVWLVCGQVALVAIGVGFFRESMSVYQAFGVGLSGIAIILLCL